jgi:ankyrin repeat protein
MSAITQSICNFFSKNHTIKNYIYKLPEKDYMYIIAWGADTELIRLIKYIDMYPFLINCIHNYKDIINTPDGNKITPFTFAMMTIENFKLLKLTLDELIKLNADINLHSHNYNALTWICEYGTYSHLELLLEYHDECASSPSKCKLDFNVTYRESTPLLLASSNTLDDDRIVNALLKYGVDLNKQVNALALGIATINSNIKIVQKLLSHNPAEYNISMATMLVTHSNEINIEILKLLLERKPNLNIVDNLKHTPLMSAVNNSSIEVVNLILSAGADLNFKNCLGKTALAVACTCALIDLEKVKLLICAGANINNQDNQGITVLMKSPYVLCKLLLLEGADINIACNKGYTALTYAAISNNTEVIKLLLKNGADLNTLNCLTTPLIETYKYLERGCNIETFKLLLELGADPNIVTTKGDTLLSMICQRKFDVMNVIQLLIPRGIIFTKLDGINDAFFTKIVNMGGNIDICATEVDKIACSSCNINYPIFFARPCSHYRYCVNCYYSCYGENHCNICKIDIASYDKLFF